jgi:hypothetical protein
MNNVKTEQINLSGTQMKPMLKVPNEPAPDLVLGRCARIAAAGNEDKTRRICAKAEILVYW